MSTTRYLVPASRHGIETIEKKSRFIAQVCRVQSPEAAKVFLAGVRSEYADARHHCWAYVAGPAGSTHPCGMSDDGEPHGTAGRPMLQILQTCGLGEIMVVVTRYFGGIKLGTGGLVRAYSGAVQAVLENLPTEEAIEKKTIQLEVAFEYEQQLRHQLGQLNLSPESVQYGNNVTVFTEMPVDAFPALKRQLISSLPHGALKLMDPE